MSSIITDNIDIWTSAIKTRSSAGRGSSKKLDLYGIKKLRELILELAVRGKLVSQDPNDEPASVLLERIAAEKAQLVKEEKIKKQKPLPPITEVEKPFELPQGWCWMRLGSVTTVSTGFAFKTSQYVDQGTFVLRVTNINNDGTINQKDNKYIDPEVSRNEFNKFKLSENDVLLVMVGGSLGKIGVVTGDVLPAVLNQNMWKLNQFGSIPTGYFLFGLKYINANQLKITASTHGHLAQGEYMSKLFPLPPLAEQHRIVAKVDELMALCDQLEQQTEASIEAHTTLVETLLATLTNSADAAELQQNWTRLADHFDTLFTTEHSIDQLKQTVLQLAVMGKLVPQDPNDEPAAVLLEKIAAEKAQLIKEKKIKKQKPLPPITEDEKPFALPEGWEWSRVGELTRLMSGKGFKKAEYSDSGARLFQIANVSLGYSKWEVENFMPLSYLEEYPELELSAGDVLIALNRPLLNKKMKVCILSESDLPAILYQRVGKFDFYGSTVSTNYFYYFMQSALFIDHLYENLQGSDQPFINQSQLVGFLFPLPPLAQQHRIVAKVDQLMTLCDQLKASLQQAQQTQLYLADALAEQSLT